MEIQLIIVTCLKLIISVTGSHCDLPQVPKKNLASPLLTLAVWVANLTFTGHFSVVSMYRDNPEHSKYITYKSKDVQFLTPVLNVLLLLACPRRQERISYFCKTCQVQEFCVTEFTMLEVRVLVAGSYICA